MSAREIPILSAQCALCGKYTRCLTINLEHHVVYICLDCFEKLMEYVELMKRTLENVEKPEYIVVTADTLSELSIKLDKLSKECKSIEIIAAAQYEDKWEALVEVVKPWKTKLRELTR